MGVLSAIGAALKAVGAYFGWAEQRSSANNSPQMQANAQAAKEAAVRDQAETDISKRDTAATERDLAE